MRIPSSHRQDAGRADSTMTPMIDVVFQLLIFFLCTASFQISEQVLPSSLKISGGAAPTTLPPELEDVEEVIIKLGWRSASPTWQVNGRPYPSLDEVGRVLRSAAAVDAKVPVLVDISPNVPLGHVIDVYDTGRLSGFSRIQFAAALRNQPASAP